MGIRRGLIALALACAAATPAVGQDAYGPIGLAGLGPQATNTVVGNATSGTAVPTALPVGSCSTAASALIWTTNTGFGCNTSITAAAVPAAGLTGATLASGVTASSLTSVGTLASLTLGGALTYGGVTLSNSVTGTGSMALSAGPTFTGNVGIGAAATFDLDVIKSSTGAVEGRVQNTSSGNSASAVYALTTGIANSYALSQIINNTGAPYYQLSAGPGIVNAYFDMPNFNFRSASGTSWMTIDTSGNAVHTGTLSASLTNVATTSAVCFNTGTKLMTYDGTLGTCTVSGLWMKDRGAPLASGALAKIALLPTESWKYKREFQDAGVADSRAHVGLYADDVEKMDKRCVAYNHDGKVQNYDDRCVIAYLVAAVRELEARK